MPCLPNHRVLLALLLLCLAAGARAEAGIQVKETELSLVEEVYHLKAEFELNFSQALEDALNKGVPLSFVAEFELSRPRWYWFDEVLANPQLQMRVSYHALTKQYRLQLQEQEQQKTFATFGELRGALGRIQEWRVAERAQLKKRYSYEARLRMRLDLTQLPKPLQVNALTSKEWSMESEWHQWTLNP